MPKRIIPQRDRIEVFVNRDCEVVLQQPRFGQDDDLIIVHRDDIPLLIKHLQSAHAEALSCEPEPTADDPEPEEQSESDDEEEWGSV